MEIINQVRSKYRDGSFKQRQLFVIMCQTVMNNKEMKELFSTHFKVDMLKLVGDKVPNVRLSLARAIRNHFKLLSGAFMYDRKVNEAVNLLKKDSDNDV